MRTIPLLLLAALCVPGFGQRMPFGVTGRTALAMDPGVKKDLKLTKDQDKQIQALLQDYSRAAQNGQVGAGFSLSNPMGAMDPKVDEILNEDQRTRLMEIFVQANGGYALLDTKVATALALTDEERSEIESTGKDGDDEAMKMMMTARSRGAINAVKAKHQEYADKMKAFLTPDQSAKFEKMRGKPFKFKD